MINFPATANQPTDGSFTHTENDQSWFWDGLTWRGETGSSYTPGPLAEHTDVSDVPATDGQALMWDGTQWVPTDVPAPEQTVVIQTTPLNLYVATTGNDTTGDGSQALPWATPHRAMKELSHLVLADGVTATVYMADGVYSLTTPLNLVHPNGTQILITGTSTVGTRPTTGLTGGAVAGNTTATKAANLALLQGFYKTELVFNNCNGMEVKFGTGAMIDKMLVRNNNAANCTGIYVESGTINVGSLVAVHNFGLRGVNVVQGTVSATGITVTNCADYGVRLVNGSTGAFQYAVSANNSSSGVVAGMASSIEFANGWSHYNSGSGLTVNNGATGRAENSRIESNSSHGLAIGASGSVVIDGAFVRSNGGDGIQATGQSFCDCRTATSRLNVGIGLVVRQGSIAMAAGATVGSNTAAQYSPALNTTGNDNALIVG